MQYCVDPSRTALYTWYVSTVRTYITAVSMYCCTCSFSRSHPLLTILAGASRGTHLYMVHATTHCLYTTGGYLPQVAYNTRVILLFDSNIIHPLGRLFFFGAYFLSTPSDRCTSVEISPLRFSQSRHFSPWCALLFFWRKSASEVHRRVCVLSYLSCVRMCDTVLDKRLNH